MDNNPNPMDNSPMDNLNPMDPPMDTLWTFPNPNPMDIHLWTTLTYGYIWTTLTLTLHSPMDNPNPNPMYIHLWTTLTLTLWTFTYGQP